MKSFAVLGLGRFGKSLAQTLYKLGHEVIAIDKDEDVVQEISDHVTHAVVGDFEDEDVLKSIGIRNFDTAIVAVADDIQVSILVTMMLKELGIKNVIAKAQSNIHARLLAKVGADSIVFPERDMAVKMAYTLTSSNFVDNIALSDEYCITELFVPEAWVNKSIRELHIRERYNINILALKRDKNVMVNISPDEIMQKNDVVVVLASIESLRMFRK